MDTITAISFTGCRPKDLYGYKDRDSYRRLMNTLQSVCTVFASNGCKTFISGGAQGTDQIAFWAVQHLKKTYPDIKNQVSIIENQSTVWPDDTLFGRMDFRRMLGKADSIHELTYNAYDARTPGQLLNLRNEDMLDKAQAVIGVFPRSKSIFKAKGSGTANCLKSALRRKLPIILVDPVNFEVYRDDTGLVGCTERKSAPADSSHDIPVVAAPANPVIVPQETLQQNPYMSDVAGFTADDVIPGDLYNDGIAVQVW